jgi:hypothetical protein
MPREWLVRFDGGFSEQSFGLKLKSNPEILSNGSFLAVEVWASGTCFRVKSPKAVVIKAGAKLDVMFQILPVGPGPKPHMAKSG